MIKRVQLIRHIKSAADLFLGFAGEITINTTDNAARVHDGATIGGHETARKDVANVPAATAVLDGKMTAAQAGDLATVKSDLTAHEGSTDGHPNATTSLSGFESGADKTKLNGVEAGATGDLSNSEFLAMMLANDGGSSGLDCEFVRGLTQTAAVVANTIMKRNADGQSQVDVPVLGADITTKTYVDSIHAALLAALSAPAGTKMLFVQTAAPTGWTKDVDQNNKALRIISGTVGTGGATAFTSVFGSGKTAGGTALTIAQLAAHTHVVGTQGSQVVAAGSGVAVANDTDGPSGSTGGGDTHNHTLSLDLQYVDIIKCTKD